MCALFQHACVRVSGSKSMTKLGQPLESFHCFIRAFEASTFQSDSESFFARILEAQICLAPFSCLLLKNDEQRLTAISKIGLFFKFEILVGEKNRKNCKFGFVRFNETPSKNLTIQKNGYFCTRFPSQVVVDESCHQP